MSQNTRAMRTGTFLYFDEIFHTTMMEALHAPDLFTESGDGFEICMTMYTRVAH